MNVRELSNFLNKHPNTIRKWISVGAIKAVKVGRDWMIPKNEVFRIMEDGVDLSREVKD